MNNENGRETIETEVPSVFTLALEKYIEIEARISDIVADSRMENNKRCIDFAQALRLRALREEKRALAEMFRSVGDDINGVRVAGSVVEETGDAPVNFYALVFHDVFGCAVIHVYPALSFRDYLSWRDVTRKPYAKKEVHDV